MSALPALSATTFLPDRERRVLTLIAEGFRDHEVAARLGLLNARRVPYRVARIRMYLGLEAAPRPQLVDHAHALGILPAPEPLQPVVPKREQYLLIRTLAAGGTIETYARERGMTRFQVNYLARKAQTVLGAATLPALVHRARQRQILGASPFAGDLARMHAQPLAEPDLGLHVIVPLVGGPRLVLPAWGLHPSRHLDVHDEAEAQAAARFLSGRDGYASVRITPAGYPDGGPVRVSWGTTGSDPPAPSTSPVSPGRGNRLFPPPVRLARPALPAFSVPPVAPGPHMCQHQPACPTADSADREAARPTASHPEQGWSLLCNGVLLFEDTGELLPDGRIIAPHRPTTAVAA